MEWTRTDAVRRRLVLAGLVVGPAVAALSAAVGITHVPDSMRQSFELMGERGQAILFQDLLETLGFTIVFASLAATTRLLRSRGGVLGTVGAILSLAGIVGFSVANASGLAVVALAQLPDREVAYGIAVSITSAGPIAIAGSVGSALEIAGQLGMLLVIAGLLRARLIPVWPIVLVVVGIAVNAAVGTMVATLVADALLVATGGWVAVALARASSESWIAGAGQTHPTCSLDRQRTALL